MIRNDAMMHAQPQIVLSAPNLSTNLLVRHHRAGLSRLAEFS